MAKQTRTISAGLEPTDETLFPNIKYSKETDAQYKAIQNMTSSVKKGITKNISKNNRDECMAYVYGVSSQITGEKQLSFIAKLFDIICTQEDEDIRMKQIRQLFSPENDITTRAVFESSFISSDIIRNLLVRQLVNSVDDETLNNKKLVTLISNLSQTELELVKMFFSYCFVVNTYLCAPVDNKECSPFRLGTNSVWITLSNFGDTKLREIGIKDISYAGFRSMCDLNLIRETSQQLTLDVLKIGDTFSASNESGIQQIFKIERMIIEFTNNEVDFTYEYQWNEEIPSVSYHQLTELGQSLFKLFNEENLISKSHLSCFTHNSFKELMLK